MNTSIHIAILIDLLASPSGMILLCLLIVAVVGAFMSEAVRTVALGIVLWVSTLPIAGLNGQRDDYHLAFPLEQIRLYSRPLTIMALLVLLPAVLSLPRGWRMRLVPLPIALFAVFQLLMAVRIVISGDSARGGLVVIACLLMLMTIGRGMSGAVQDMDGVRRLLWAVLIGTIGVVVSTTYQVIIDRSMAVWSNRLFGVTGNPQFLACVLSFSLPIVYFLLSKGQARKITRVPLYCLLIVMLIFLAWTGSRTGALSVVLGTVVFYHRRLGQFAIMAALMCVGIMAISPWFEGSLELSNRLVSTEDTRSANWIGMLNAFYANPWFGSANEGVSGVENSYLSMLGQLGIFGTLPFVFAAGALLFQLLRIQQLRQGLGQDAVLIDCVNAMWVAIAVGAMFEGFLVGVIVFPVLLVYVLGVVNGFLEDLCDLQTAQALEQEHWPQPHAHAA